MSIAVWERLWAVLVVTTMMTVAVQAQTFSSIFTFDVSDGGSPFLLWLRELTLASTEQLRKAETTTAIPSRMGAALSLASP